MKKYVFSLLILLSILSFSYAIRIGDTLTIEVFGQPDFSRTVRVANDGTIPYPYAGNLKVAGLTADQVKPLIEQAVGKFIKNPVVTVYVSQYAPMFIFIQGVMNRTFDISFLPEVTLSKLFSYLNITNASEIDFTNVKITKKGKTDTYNVMGYFYDGTISKDPVIEEGDIIYLPPLTYDKAVQVSGAYTYSTAYEPGLTLRTLLLKLGPLNKDIAQIESSVLVVDSKAVTINLEDVIYGKIDYALKQGSTLYIPKRDERYVYVIGYVPSTGIKTFLPTEQLTLNLALAKAGGIAKEDYKWVESILITTPDGKVQNYDSTLLSKANEVKLTTGTVVEIRKYPEFKIYVTGDFAQQSTVTFDPDEPRTLSQLFVKIGGLKTDQMKWIESVKMNNQAVDMSKLSTYALKDKDVVEIKKYPEFKVYVTGDFAQQSTVTFDPDEPRTLSQLFVKIGGLKTDQMKWIESVKINNQTIDMSKLSAYTLKDKDVVEIKRYAEFKVYVTGDFAQQSTVTFDPDEPRTLSQLFVKIGGLKTDQMKWIESIKINNQTIDMSKLSTYMLKDKDVVEIKRYAEFKVYVTGDFAQQSTVTFDPDEPRTLSQLFVKIGGLKTDQMKWIESIKINNQAVDMSKLSTYTLKDKDIVEIKKYPEFYVYVQGLVNTKGKIVFEPGESKTLKLLVAKVGLPSEDIENEGYATINNSSTIDLKDVIYGSKDYELDLGDIVQITYDPFIVNTIGTSVGTVQLTYKEPRTLSYLIKKLGILQPESIEKVLLIRDGKQQEYAINQLLYDQISVPLAKYDTVILKQAETNAVYLTGDVAAYVTFAYNEPITMQRVLAKVGLSDLRKISKINDGVTSIDFTKDLPIQKGAILNVQLKKPIYVTAMGYIKNTGRVSFDYYETADLQTLFAKLGGLIIAPDEYYVSDKVRIIRQDKILEYDAQRVFKGLDNISLEDGDFVYVTESAPKQVYVFGKGMQNGLVRFTQSEDFDLRTLIGKLGGIKEGTSKDLVIIGDESTKITWNEYVNLPLKSNSTVLFDVDTKNYIYVVDPTGKPNMLYTDRNMTLYEVLSKVGMSKNYGKIELTSGTSKQVITLKSISEATGYNVKPGDIVRISDAAMNFVYVLGEVKNPGIVQVTEGMTVLQAIIQSGYFTSKAVPSTVWLYKGGVNGQAVKINLSATTSGGNIDLTTVEPGDVVFVPADMFKTAADWISTIAPLVNMFSTIYGLFN